MSELNIEIIPPEKPFWDRGMQITFVAIIVAFLLLFTCISYIIYTREIQNRSYVTNYPKVCGDVNYQDVSFSTYMTQDNNQILCTFDNGLEAWVDKNGILYDNPAYHVCYKLVNIMPNNEFEEVGVQCWGGRK